MTVGLVEHAAEDVLLVPECHPLSGITAVPPIRTDVGGTQNQILKSNIGTNIRLKGIIKFSKVPC